MNKIIESHGGDSVATLVAGTSFVPLPSHLCNEVAIFQETGVSIDVLPYGSDLVGGFVTMSSPSGAALPCAGNSSEYSVRRTDQTGTPTTVRFLHRQYLR